MQLLLIKVILFSVHKSLYLIKIPLSHQRISCKSVQKEKNHFMKIVKEITTADIQKEQDN
jgi:hypothetical protein